MRDINRIDPFLKEVGEIWKKRFPDWRFGQLMYNFICETGDPFYWEEEEFLAKLRDYLKGDKETKARIKASQHDGELFELGYERGEVNLVDYLEFHLLIRNTVDYDDVLVRRVIFDYHLIELILKNSTK